MYTQHFVKFLLNNLLDVRLHRVRVSGGTGERHQGDLGSRDPAEARGHRPGRVHVRQTTPELNHSPHQPVSHVIVFKCFGTVSF